MKRKLILCLCAACALLLLTAACMAATSFTDGDWDYEIADNGSIALTGYHGSAADVTLPESVEYDGQSYVIRTVAANCFADNTILHSVVIPARYTTVGNCAFKNCTALSSVTILGDLTDCDNRSAKSDSWDDQRCHHYSVFYNTGTNAPSFTVTFGEGVTRVPAYLFATGYDKQTGEYAHITRLILSDTVETVGTGAFYCCYDLTDVQMGEGVTAIEESAFARCTDLPAAPMGQGVTTIGQNAYQGCTGMTDAIFGPSVSAVGDSAFSDCTKLRNVTLNDRLTTIGSQAFYGCTALAALKLPPSVQTLGNCAFKNCTSLSDLTILGDLTDCDSRSTKSDSWDDQRCHHYSVFYNTGTNAPSFTVTFGEGVTRIPECLFATGYEKSAGEYAHVTDLVISDTVSEIGSNAFCRCYDLKTVHLGDGVTDIGSYSFVHCTALTAAPMGDGVFTVGEGAFCDCTGMTTAVFGSEVTDIGPSAFSGCTKLRSVDFNDKLSRICDNAFLGCQALTGIVIPPSVQTIENCAFKNCTALSSVTILGDLTDCDSRSAKSDSWDDQRCHHYSVFYNTGTNAPSFTVTFGEGVTRVPAYLFATGYDKQTSEYARVTRVVIPASVRTVGDGAFIRCYDLKEAVFAGAPEAIAENAFDGCDNTGFAIHGNAGGSVEAFAAARALPFIAVEAKELEGIPAAADDAPAGGDWFGAGDTQTSGDGSWTCSNGHAGNTGNFCPECGEHRPEGRCAACGFIFEGPAPKFCPNCGAQQ